jgi:hypothetical protein
VSLEFKVVIEPKTAPVLPNTLTYETGATRSQAADPDLYAYEHHGDGFGQADPGALTSFFEDLILGRSMPLVFATRAIRDVDTLFAMALFLHRELAIHPAMSGIVAQVDLVHRRGLPMLGHLDRDFARFLRLLRAYFPEGLSQTNMGHRLTMAMGWIREYVLEGKLPALGKPFADAHVLDRGTDGFVVATTTGDLLEGWVTLFSHGHLRGILVGADVEGRRKVLCARKSHFRTFDLDMAARLFNEMEAAIGEDASWKASGDWLWGPPRGTVLQLPHMLEILIRV